MTCLILSLVLLQICCVFSAPVNSTKTRPFKQNPDEAGLNFEGDIVLHPDQLIFPLNGILNEYYRWENGIIPYVFSAGHHTTAERNIILAGMNEVSLHTCIRFVARTTQSDYVEFKNDNSGCWSYVGRIRGAQVLNLHNGGGCVHKGITMHELLHAIGFFHSHSDLNRDQYIRVAYENIEEVYYRHFTAYSNNYVTNYGQGYDYGSILHYGPWAFTKNGEVTIVPLQAGAEIGQRDALSAKDIAKVNAMYSCPTTTTTTTTTRTTTTPATTTTQFSWNKLPSY